MEVKVVAGDEAYQEAKIKEYPPVWNLTTWRLIGCLVVGCFCQTMNGYDGSLFGGLTANKVFLAYFHGAVDGNWTAIVSAMYQIGSVAALPFVGPAIDTWGRRVGMFIGAFLILLGVIITGTTIENQANGTHQLMGGRFLLGFGVSIVSSAGPIYVVETAHPAWRSILTAYCNTFWFTGSILASGAVRGGLNLAGNTSWQLPTWLQIFFPGLICIFAFVIPESPRWLYVNNKRSQAVALLTDWHGYGSAESPWVKLQLAEYEEFLVMDGAVSECTRTSPFSCADSIRTNAGGITAHSSRTAPVATALDAIVSSPFSRNGRATECSHTSFQPCSLPPVTPNRSPKPTSTWATRAFNSHLLFSERRLSSASAAVH